MKDIGSLIEEVSNFVAPSWNIKSFVGVNPYWNVIGHNFFESLSYVTHTTGRNQFALISYFLDKFKKNEINEEHIIYALKLEKNQFSQQDLNMLLKQSYELQEKTSEYDLVSDFFRDNFDFDAQEFIVSQVSKYCSSYFDNGLSSFGLKFSQKSLYEEWLDYCKIDASVRFCGFSIDPNSFDLIKKDKIENIEFCLNSMGITKDDDVKRYLLKICYNLMGWCSHIKYHLWQKDLSQVSNNRGTIVADILSIFLSYEFVLFNSLKNMNQKWLTYHNSQKSFFDNDESSILVDVIKIWQTAHEYSYQSDVINKLSLNGSKKSTTKSVPKAQMVFCIDVRSEVMRRCIETTLPDVNTFGFAGFFGVSLECHHVFEPKHTLRCPVLLKPKIHIQENFETKYESKMFGSKSLEGFLNGLKQGLSSSLLFVELFGSLFGLKLARKIAPSTFDFNHLVHKKFYKSSFLKYSLDLNKKSEIATFFIKKLGIKQFSPYIFVCGHGSVTQNNLFESALDCGACGGYSGELNSKFICEILNDPEVRKKVNEDEGIFIPENTLFIASVHETVSDEIFIIDKTLEKNQNIKHFLNGFKIASRCAQNDRSKRFECFKISHKERATNWSEIRPEWALVNNASFIVAPRERSKNINLEGRAFLHDYDYESDADGSTLELIMTAPMVVTNWINMQYYFSSVDPKTFSSGNKTIQNMVGLFGVIEGNGGDLKIGLPLQSVNDGQKRVHEPLRLSVFIEAPTQNIEKVISKHQVVRNLVENGWLNVFCIDANQNQVLFRRPLGGYVVPH